MRLLTVNEVAERLSIRPVTVRLFMRRRQLEFIRVGQWAIRIPESEVERVIEAGRVPAHMHGD